jgi:uncharacterized membrane protein YfcA
MSGHTIYWHLPPLVLAVSLVYAATRHEDWNRILWRTLYWVRYILGFLGSAFIALLLLDYFRESWWKPALAAATLWYGGKYLARRRKKKPAQSPPAPA